MLQLFEPYKSRVVGTRAAASLMQLIASEHKNYIWGFSTYPTAPYIVKRLPSGMRFLTLFLLWSLYGRAAYGENYMNNVSELQV